MLLSIASLFHRLQRQALRETARYLERHEQQVLEYWTGLLARETTGRQPAVGYSVERGRENLRLIVAALRADKQSERQQLQDDVARWGAERARWGLNLNLALADLLEPHALFRQAVQTSVQRMLARRLWLAVPSDVLFAVAQINAAIDRQMLTISQAYVTARDHIIGSNEEALEASNRQLTLLNLEMQHRIKNNLQTVADLLSLEISQGVTKPAAEYLRESLGRIKSIAAVHEMLSPDNAQATDAIELARRVADIAVRGLAGGRQVDVRVEGPALLLQAKAATSLALVLNELVTNSIEHAFPLDKGGQIAVRFSSDGSVGTLDVADDGVGLAPDFEIDREQNLGLRIVRALVADDLKGSLELRSSGGTKATVRFLLG